MCLSMYIICCNFPSHTHPPTHRSMRSVAAWQSLTDRLGKQTHRNSPLNRSVTLSLCIHAHSSNYSTAHHHQHHHHRRRRRRVVASSSSFDPNQSESRIKIPASPKSPESLAILVCGFIYFRHLIVDYSFFSTSVPTFLRT